MSRKTKLNIASIAVAFFSVFWGLGTANLKLLAVGLLVSFIVLLVGRVAE